MRLFHRVEERDRNRTTGHVDVILPAVIQAQRDQIGDIGFPYAYDRVLAAPIDLHHSIGLMRQKTGVCSSGSQDSVRANAITE
jgi:hypothetical protein